MNCKPGDLAIIIRGHRPGSTFVGTIVEVLDVQRHQSVFGLVWNVRFPRALVGVAVSKTGLHLGPSGLSAVHGVPDAWMKPIRDQPGADETLEWAPVPALDVPDTAPAAPAETPEPEEVPA